MMNKDDKLILMYKDFEVLSFKADLEHSHFEVIDKLERFDLAPFQADQPDIDLNYYLSRFFHRRAISMYRRDYKLIIDNTHCKNNLELAFKGHGLSLMNHYWFKKEGEELKYDDINFFTNKWDDSFAKAVLNGDYEALSKCDLNVPDITTPGWSVKGWVYEDGPKLIKLGIVKDHYEDSIGEVLASRCAQRFLGEDKALKYELVKLGDKYGSKSPCMLTIDEELIPMSNFIPDDVYKLYFGRSKNKQKHMLFYEKLKESYPPEFYQLFVEIDVLRSLCFGTDLHFENISLIRNVNTRKVRPAPIYDLAGAFGSSQTGRAILSKLDKNTYFIIYYLYNMLNPNWDYSWYDSTKLEGFEDEIREYLSKSEFYTPDLIDRIIEVFKLQKQSIDELSKKV